MRVHDSHCANRPWNHFFYQILDGAIPPTADPFTLTTLGKVGIDQFVQAPIFTIIILYFFAVAEGKGVGYASKQVQNDLGGILIKNWSIFLPATAINLAYCPPELRVLFLNWCADAATAAHPPRVSEPPFHM